MTNLIAVRPRAMPGGSSSRSGNDEHAPFTFAFRFTALVGGRVGLTQLNIMNNVLLGCEGCRVICRGDGRTLTTTCAILPTAQGEFEVVETVVPKVIKTENEEKESEVERVKREKSETRAVLSSIDRKRREAQAAGGQKSGALQSFKKRVARALFFLPGARKAAKMEREKEARAGEGDQRRGNGALASERRWKKKKKQQQGEEEEEEDSWEARKRRLDLKYEKRFENLDSF